MKRLLNIKILVLFLIICGGTYALTRSVAIVAGVAILMYVTDQLLGAWADKKDRQYFYHDEAVSEEDSENSENKDNK